MYLRHLLVAGSRLLRALQVPFVRGDDTPRPWTVFVGDEGTCKSTLLRMIALAAAGSEIGSALAPDVAPYRDRRGPDTALRVDASFARGADLVIAQVTAEPGWQHRSWSGPLEGGRRPTTGDVIDRARSDGARGWFVAGYGAGRALTAPGDARLGDDPACARLQGLFEPVPLLALGFHDELADDGDLGAAFAVCLREALLDRMRLRDLVGLELDPPSVEWHPVEKIARTGVQRRDDLMYYIKQGDVWAVRRAQPGKPKASATLIERAGVEMDYERYLYFLDGDGDIARKAKYGKPPVERHRALVRAGAATVEVPATWLGQGHQAVIALVADLIGHAWLEAGAPVALDDLSGLVLVDDLELHLDPPAHADLIPALKRTFPRLQFVVTTRSPQLAAGASADELWTLAREPTTGDVTAAPAG
jgi:hypothetical protein